MGRLLEEEREEEGREKMLRKPSKDTFTRRKMKG